MRMLSSPRADMRPENCCPIEKRREVERVLIFVDSQIGTTMNNTLCETSNQGHTLPQLLVDSSINILRFINILRNLMKCFLVTESIFEI